MRSLLSEYRLKLKLFFSCVDNQGSTKCLSTRIKTEFEYCSYIFEIITIKNSISVYSEVFS